MLKSSFVALALALSVVGQTQVSLLTDFAGYAKSGTLNIASTLAAVSARKGATFHFGSTYDTTVANQGWMPTVFGPFFNHLVAENGCKWQSTEPTRGVSSLTACQGAQSFATSHNATFRGHNTFWHSQTPSWLPGSVTASDLVTNVIPQHVMQEVQGMGTNVVSWDIVNEIVGDGVSNGMTAWNCVKNKNDWPTQTSDGSGTNLVTDLTFVHAAFSTALQYAGSNTRLMINDYNTGPNNAKTACMFTLLADITENTSVPYSRLGVGFQSHISTSSFTSKADISSAFSKLAALGATGAITELDISIGTNNSGYQRLQAAIWGDLLDACLYASNCFEFINWDPRDDMSWLGTSEAGTLFDSNGNPKLAAYEVAARLQRYANGEAELCATALGTSQCMASGPSTTSTPPVTTSPPPVTTSPPPATTTTPPAATQSHWGQCGGIGWTGPTVCASPYTCQVSNPYYSQCL